MRNKASALLTARYAAIQGIYWGLFGALVAFASILLASRGFSNTQIGIVLAVSNVLSVVLQPAIAAMPGKFPQINLRRIVFFLIAIVAAGTMLLTITGAGSLLLNAALFIITNTALQTLHPFINALGFALNTPAASANFGVARSMGSIAYAAIASLLGIFVANRGTALVPAVAFALCLCLLVACLFYKNPTQTVNNTPQKEQPQEGGTAFVKGNPMFLLFLLGILCVFACYQMCIAFLAQIMELLGGNSTGYGVAIAICALLEAPTMILFTRISKRIPCGTLIKLSGVFFLAKVLCYLVAVSPAMLYAGQFMQPLGYALFIPASVYYVEQLLPAKHRVKGHAFVTAANTAGNVIGSLLGGRLLDSFGHTAMLAAAAALTTIGMLLFFVSARNPKPTTNASALPAS